MQTFSDRVAAKAAELIDEEVVRVTQILVAANPEAVPDYATYRHHAAQVRGLNEAKTLIVDAVALVQQETRPETQKAHFAGRVVQVLS